MRKASTLRVGDRFRPAHPGQISFNGEDMSRDVVYRVFKVFSVPPYVRVCYEAKDRRRIGQMYTILPETYILYPEESPPTEENLRKITGVRRRLIGYRVKCTLTDVENLEILSSRTKKLLKLIVGMGKEVVLSREIAELAKKHATFFPWSYVLYGHLGSYYTKYYLPLGLLEEVYSSTPGTEGRFNYEESNRDN
jgi:hypothetical protein